MPSHQKIENHFISLKKNTNHLNNQNGQTLVEFIMLLASIVLVSMIFMKIVNGNIAKYWSSMANTLLIDVEGNQKLELR